MIVNPDPFLDTCFIKRKDTMTPSFVSNQTTQLTETTPIVQPVAIQEPIIDFTNNKDVEKLEKAFAVLETVNYNNENNKNDKNDKKEEIINILLANHNEDEQEYIQKENDYLKEQEQQLLLQEEREKREEQELEKNESGIKEELRIKFSDDVLDKEEDDSNMLLNIHDEDTNISLFDVEELKDTNEESSNLFLEEVDVNTLNQLNKKESSGMTLKKPNEVYYNLYKETKKKAKDFKKNAILSYMEAENIKKTYMLDNITEEDSDEDDFYKQ